VSCAIDAEIAEQDRAKLERLAKGYYGASIMPVEVMKEMAQRLTACRRSAKPR